MKRSPKVYVALTVATVAAGCVDSTELAGQQRSELAAIVAAQAAAEYGAIPGRFAGRFDPESIRFEATSLVQGDRMRVVRAFPPIDHAHPYLILVTSSDTVRLGGFSEVQLLSAFTVLELSVTEAASAVEAAKALIVLADQNGAERLLLELNNPPTSEHDAVQAWLSVRPTDWPTDTVAVATTGNITVRLTALSQDLRSYPQAWKPIAYQFEFGPDGNLIAWAGREGDSLHK